MVISSPTVMLVSPVVAKTSNVALPTISTTPSAPSTISQSGKDGEFTTQAALGLTRATQTDNLANSKTYYDISFRTATAGIIKTIQMAFPPGTYVGAAVLVEATGIGPGTIAASGNTVAGMTLTYTVTNEVNVPALTRMRIQVANVNNPPDPSNSLTVTITTRDSFNTIIDGPTATNAYNIKQIGFDTVRRNGPAQSVNPGETKTSIAECEPGEELLGGGWETTFAGGDTVTRYNGKPIGDNDDDNRWEVGRVNTGTVASNFYAIAMCAPSGLS
jgi:hypothetical protein